MSNMFQQAKQLMEMRSQMKKVQKELESVTEEYENSGVKVTARGDMTVVSVKINPEVIDITRIEKLERTISENTNKALSLVKKHTAEMTQQMLKDNGGLGALGSMFGK